VEDHSSPKQPESKGTVSPGQPTQARQSNKPVQNGGARDELLRIWLAEYTALTTKSSALVNLMFVTMAIGIPERKCSCLCCSRVILNSCIRRE
jgi:hypothetical protein